MIVMKMAVVSTGLLLLLLGSIFTSADSQCDYYVATKQDFAVPLDSELNDSLQLRWRHGNEIIFDRKGTEMVVGKADDVYQNGSLRLKNVDRSKAGKYTPLVYHKGNAIGSLKAIQLCVIDPVSKPRVKVECLGKDVKFTCQLNQTSQDVTLQWLQNNELMSSETSQSFKKPLDAVETVEFKCRVSNKVSNLISDPLKQNCKLPPPDNEFDFLDFILDNIWIVAGVGGGLVVLLIIIVICFCIKNKRKKRRQVKEEEELRLDWSNSSSQHPHHKQNQPPSHPPPPHHHHHHPHVQHPPHQHPHRQQQPAGHTGPRQHRSKQPSNHKKNPAPQGPQVPQAPSHPPQPGTRRAIQCPKPPVESNAEQRPPLPQPRRKVQKKSANGP